MSQWERSNSLHPIHVLVHLQSLSLPDLMNRMIAECVQMLRQPSSQNPFREPLSELFSCKTQSGPPSEKPSPEPFLELSQKPSQNAVLTYDPL